MGSVKNDRVEQPSSIESARSLKAEADSANNDTLKVELYWRAAMAYGELGAYDEKVGCLLQACGFLRGDELVDCLLACWETYIEVIAVYQYDSGFEWRGEVENLDGSYEETIESYHEKAVDVLMRAFDVGGADRRRLLERLNAECSRRRAEGGWASTECLSSIKEVLKRV